AVALTCLGLLPGSPLWPLTSAPGHWADLPHLELDLGCLTAVLRDEADQGSAKIVPHLTKPSPTFPQSGKQPGPFTFSQASFTLHILMGGGHIQSPAPCSDGNGSERGIDREVV